MGGCRFGIPAGSEPEGFARAKRRSAEGTPLGGSADSQIHPKMPPPLWVSALLYARRVLRTRRVRASEATLRRLVAGKAPWQAARYACRLACCACRSSSQKSRFAAIFGSPVITPLGVSADSQYTKNAATRMGSGTFVCPPLFLGRRAESCCLQFFPGAAKQKQPAAAAKQSKRSPAAAAKITDRTSLPKSG